MKIRSEIYKRASASLSDLRTQFVSVTTMPMEKRAPLQNASTPQILVDFATRLPPWMSAVPSIPQESAFARLSREIRAMAQVVSPTEKERAVRMDIVSRLQRQVSKTWPDAKVIPIGSYAQDLYSSSRYLSQLALSHDSDMDLFVKFPFEAESLRYLEQLYNVIESSSLAVPGSLNMVSSARVPIIKYTDSRGSGIQVDVSINNISATSSTEFIQRHLFKNPILRPLTIVLKQWLFQRQMNEVYSRGGLSSYALFLLILTVTHEREYSSDEDIGKTLFQFLKQWSHPTGFSKIIRPLEGPLEKPVRTWEDMYQPYLLCISVYMRLI
jgi:non-canonical poly(A) RNA polymerase PAPD5/7